MSSVEKLQYKSGSPEAHVGTGPVAAVICAAVAVTQSLVREPSVDGPTRNCARRMAPCKRSAPLKPLTKPGPVESPKSAFSNKPGTGKWRLIVGSLDCVTENSLL